MSHCAHCPSPGSGPGLCGRAGGRPARGPAATQPQPCSHGHAATATQPRSRWFRFLSSTCFPSGDSVAKQRTLSVAFYEAFGQVGPGLFSTGMTERLAENLVNSTSRGVCERGSSQPVRLRSRPGQGGGGRAVFAVLVRGCAVERGLSAGTDTGWTAVRRERLCLALGRSEASLPEPLGSGRPGGR